MPSITIRVHLAEAPNRPDRLAEDLAQFLANGITRGDVRQDSQPFNATSVEAWPTREA